jgi:hypothetical protein
MAIGHAGSDESGTAAVIEASAKKVKKIFHFRLS